MSNVKQLILSVLPKNNFNNIYRVAAELQWPSTVPTPISEKACYLFQLDDLTAILAIRFM